MIEIIIAAVLGIGGGAVGWHFLAPDDDATAENLSDGKSTRPLCTPAAVREFGAALCRELECNRNGQGNAARPAGCESISNINNTRAIWEACEPIKDAERRTACFAHYRERK